MPSKKEVLDVDGIDVSVSNPDKVFFPKTGHTKLDLVNYYLAVADGALRGVDGRPMALKRYVNGAEGEFFFQKRAPTSRPDWIEVVELAFPSGRTADEVVIDDAAGLAWVINLGCIDLNPHPVRAEDLDHPDELRVDLDPIPGVSWPQIRDVAMVTKEVLDDLGMRGWPKTSGSRGFHVYCRIEPRWTFPEVRRAALALAREVERRAPDLATSRWWKEERHGVFLDYNQNAKDRTVASAYSVRSTPSPSGSRRSATRSSRWTRRAIRWNGCSSCRPSTRRPGSATRRGRLTSPSRPASRRGSSPRSDARRVGSPSGRASSRPRRRASGPGRRGGGGRPCRSSRWPGHRPRPMPGRGWSAGRGGIPRHGRTSGRPTCWWTRCAAEARRGRGSASTCGTCRRGNARSRKPSRSTTTRGKALRAGRDRFTGDPEVPPTAPSGMGKTMVG